MINSRIKLIALVLLLLISLCSCGGNKHAYGSEDSRTVADTAVTESAENADSVDSVPAESTEEEVDSADIPFESTTEETEASREPDISEQDDSDSSSMLFPVESTIGNSASYELTLDFSRFSSEPTSSGMRYSDLGDPDTYLVVNFVPGMTSDEDAKTVAGKYVDCDSPEHHGEENILDLDVRGEHVSASGSDSNLEVWMVDVPGGCAEFALVWPVGGSPEELYSILQTLVITY